MLKILDAKKDNAVNVGVKVLWQYSECCNRYGVKRCPLFKVLWQYSECCNRYGVKRCLLFKVLYLDRMFQCGLHAVLWSRIGKLIRYLAAEHRSTAGNQDIYDYRSSTQFYSCLRLRFLVVETNPGPRRPAPASSRILCSKVRGLSRNLSDLAVASS